ncbi:MAG TPA: CDP-alcohol phosphatidyltransferase family protein [Pyrinomonadaceae bacterium]|nr:CDP-alcohol phosphatidyltransferase family protein [Pyrinomonadaceae bacterium]
MSSSRIVTVPNMLTVFRMVLIPVFVTLLFYQRFVLALAVFVIAGLTDGLDGILARRFQQESQLGTVLDPIADKLMMVTAFIVLSMRSIFPQPVPSHLPIPFWVTIAVISRDVFIVVGAAAINIMTGFRGFRPSWLGKANTTVQIIAIAIIMFAASVPYYTGYYLPTVYVIVFTFAVTSGLHYIFFASRLLNEDRRQNAENAQETQ